MMMKYLLFFLFSLTVWCDDSIIRYYENLINNNVERASNYELPTDAREFLPHNSSVKVFGTFDFIIIGAGSAGTVIANRLSEIKHWNILVLEAGTYGNDFTDIPAMTDFISQSQYNWGYSSVPQKTACLAFKNSKCPYTRGRGVGGSSLINGLVYSRGSKKDFDWWAAIGNDGWSYEEVLPYFKKSEDYHRTVAYAPVDEYYHGEGGYLNVEYYRPFNNNRLTFLQGLYELGYNMTDYNGANILGMSPAQTNTKFGKRDDCNHAFIDPVKFRTNLHISTSSFVTRLLINGKRTYGVEFVRQGQIYHAFINFEVVLSAGSVGSPQILMHSGIGPGRHLRDKRIPLVVDLPVGITLRDHTVISFPVCHNGPLPSNETLRKKIQEYLRDWGPFTLSSTSDLAFIQTPIEKITDYPDLEVIFFPQRIAFMENGHDPDCNFFSVGLMGLHTKSVGSIRLKSNNPFDYPLIDTNFYSDPGQDDVNTIYEGLKILKKLEKTAPFRKINATLYISRHKDCSNLPYQSKEYILCYIKHYSFSAMHPVATCSMGTDPKKGAVVDPTLRVFGIKRLRVADASVIPRPVTGHTHAPCVMIGEKASDLIKFTYLDYQNLLHGYYV